MKGASALALLCLSLGGCTLLNDFDLPAGCEIEDEDGDGVLSEACGGSDCDDQNPSRSPLLVEICDDADVDEDCDLSTFGADRDGDGQVALRCCNVNSDGSRFCGTDCNDARGTVYEGAPELCNLSDDDCDGEVDEELAIRAYFPDCDKDMLGDDHAAATEGCAAPLLDPTCPAPFDGAWVTRTGDCDDRDDTRQTACGACAAVDLLIVMSTSGSMQGEQARFAAEIPGLVVALADGDNDGDGRRDTEPIEDLQVAVVTPDLGVGGSPTADPNCTETGEDGVLRSFSGATDIPMCAAREHIPNFLAFVPGSGSRELFIEDWSCLVQGGTNGCRFPQILEASLKALTPARSPLRFHGNTLGHGDGLNRGFLRDDSLLVVLVVTDQDDCSALDFDVYDPGSTRYAGADGVRCAKHPEALQPVSRYVSGLLALRAASDVVFGTVSGVPQALIAGMGEEPDYDLILSDETMDVVIDPVFPDQLRPSCVLSGGVNDVAFPPVRLLTLARDLSARGAETFASSICSPTAYGDVASLILSSASAVATRRCGER